MSATGIDVHGGKGAVNWSAVRKSGRRFAWVKATEGETYTDDHFTTNRGGAKAAGMLVGAYHFARPDLHRGGAGAVAEAEHFLAVAKPVKGELLPVLDFETSPLTAGWALAWLRHVYAATGRRPLLYTSTSMAVSMWAGATAAQRAELSHYLLWLADYGPNDGVDHGIPGARVAGMKVVVHQFTSVGSTPGVSGACDVDKRVCSTYWPLLYKRQWWVTISGGRSRAWHHYLRNTHRSVTTWAKRRGAVQLVRRWLAR